MRWAAVMAVAALVAAVVAALRFVSGGTVEAIAATVLLIMFMIGWWGFNRLQKARVTIDSAGIRREGRGGFSYTWDQVKMVGIGEGFLVPGAPYLVIATHRRRRHLSASAVAGSGLKRPSAAVPLDPGMVDQVHGLLTRLNVLRTEEQWLSEL